MPLLINELLAMNQDELQMFLVGTPRFGAEPDGRVADWPLLGDWRQPFAITVLYLVGIYFGTKIMKNREPFKLKTVSMIHNMILFFASIYMTVETAICAYNAHTISHGEFKIICNDLDESDFSDKNPYLERFAFVLWFHYLTKCYEFVDTFIIVAKKANHRLSFLHVYHHATMFFPVWFLNVKYGPGGEAFFACFLNSAVHVVMYGYYFASGLGFRFENKQLVTIFQMAQFVAFIIQSISGTYLNCYQPRLSVYLLGFQCIIFFILFTNFFIQAYVLKKKKTTKKTE